MKQNFHKILFKNKNLLNISWLSRYFYKYLNKIHRYKNYIYMDKYLNYLIFKINIFQ